jgi:hypothetical protein
MPEWPFEDPPNVAVIADRRIVFEGDWVAYVTHDEDDGAWQFHVRRSTGTDERHAALVSLQSVVSRDPTVAELADLPPGWCAFRTAKNAPWQRRRKQPSIS